MIAPSILKVKVIENILCKRREAMSAADIKPEWLASIPITFHVDKMANGLK